METKQRIMAHGSSGVVLYTIPNNSECKLARQFLLSRGVKFEEADVTRSAAAFEEMLKFAPNSLPPVLKQGEKTVSGFSEKSFAAFLSL